MANKIGQGLCKVHGCRLFDGHVGVHNPFPSTVWSFMKDVDQKKLGKAGFATPRGGKKGAYQNHVVRSNKVIIPYERFHSIGLETYKHGYIIRLLPEQFFERPGVPRAEFAGRSAKIVIGDNAFVLYRTHESYSSLPPLPSWEVRGLVKDGKPNRKRGKGICDSGHYVLRLPTLGSHKANDDGPPQGIFAPEYADEETLEFRTSKVTRMPIYAI